MIQVSLKNAKKGCFLFKTLQKKKKKKKLEIQYFPKKHCQFIGKRLPPDKDSLPKKIKYKKNCTNEEPRSQRA